MRTLHLLACRALGRDPDAGRPLPVRLGMWPAAAGLLAFTWLELVAPDPASPTALLLFLALYCAVHLVGAARHGAHWFDHADAFEVYSGLLARLAPLGRRPADRRLVLRSPFNGLDATPQLPGLVATVCVMLGSTAYDGFSDAPSWIAAVQTSPWAAPPRPRSDSWAPSPWWPPSTRSAPVPPGCSPADCRTLTAFAHSLVPIALGYLVAHYFTLFVTEGPRTVMVALGTDNPAPPEPPWVRAVSPPSRSSRSSSATSWASSRPTTVPYGSSRPAAR